MVVLVSLRWPCTGASSIHEQKLGCTTPVWHVYTLLTCQVLLGVNRVYPTWRYRPPLVCNELGTAAGNVDMCLKNQEKNKHNQRSYTAWS